MIKWEYRYIDAEICDQEGCVLTDLLTKFGKEGWRLVPGMYTGLYTVLTKEEAEQAEQIVIMEREITK